MGLDLYARIEPFLGFEEQKRALYDLFLHKLQELGVQKVLDIGCGSGAFMKLALEQGFDIVGIDISQEMVERARAQGLKAYRKDVCEVEERFEAAVAVFDVINYLKPQELASFFGCIKELLKSGGYFLCDINTLVGFEEVAQGALIVERGDHFIALEAEFHQERLTTKLYSFKRVQGCYTKESEEIVQYYHHIERLKSLGLKLVDIDFVALFGEEPDKALLSFVKE